VDGPKAESESCGLRRRRGQRAGCPDVEESGTGPAATPEPRDEGVPGAEEGSAAKALKGGGPVGPPTRKCPFAAASAGSEASSAAAAAARLRRESEFPAAAATKCSELEPLAEAVEAAEARANSGNSA